MKKLFAALLVLALAFTGCAMAETLSVIATPSPHAEVVRLIEEDLAAAGYELELIEVTDYVTENPAVAGGDVMINFFQHIPYLDGYNASVSEEEQLAAVIPTHFEPMGIYPGTKTSLDEIAEGDAIAVPNDPRLPAAGRRRPHLRARGNHAGKHRHPGRHHRRSQPQRP